MNSEALCRSSCSLTALSLTVKFPRPVALLGPVADLVIGSLCESPVENGGTAFCRPGTRHCV